MQTRLLSRCPSHKYNPYTQGNCGNCKNCDQGLPCGCYHCNEKNTLGLSVCRPGIIPIEGVQSRQGGRSCNTSKNLSISNFFQFHCANPQDPNRIFHSPSARTDLGANTRQNFKDMSTLCGGNERQWGNESVMLPEMEKCNYGGLGCRSLRNDDFKKGIYF
jgi:hypothetical protein